MLFLRRFMTAFRAPGGQPRECSDRELLLCARLKERELARRALPNSRSLRDQRTALAAERSAYQREVRADIRAAELAEAESAALEWIV